MKSINKLGLIITKVRIWKGVENDAGDRVSECEIMFNDKSTIKYECDDVKELEYQNSGIYELVNEDTYIQIENWK